MMFPNVCTFVFFVFFLPLSQNILCLSLLLSVLLLFYLFLFLFSLFSSHWLGRASPPVSWRPCPSGQPWRRPMGPLPCLTAACSSTNRPWPACSFSSRLLSSHQVWLRQRLARGCPDRSNPASCLAVVGQSARWQDRFGCFTSSGVRLNLKQRVSAGQQNAFRREDESELCALCFVWRCMGCGVFLFTNCLNNNVF